MTDTHRELQNTKQLHMIDQEINLKVPIGTKFQLLHTIYSDMDDTTYLYASNPWSCLFLMIHIFHSQSTSHPMHYFQSLNKLPSLQSCMHVISTNLEELSLSYDCVFSAFKAYQFSSQNRVLHQVNTNPLSVRLSKRSKNHAEDWWAL